MLMAGIADVQKRCDSTGSTYAIGSIRGKPKATITTASVNALRSASTNRWPKRWFGEPTDWPANERSNTQSRNDFAWWPTFG